jgi:hypothetical protein
MDAGREKLANALQGIMQVRPGLQANVDAVELAQAVEAPLRSRDIGERADAPQRRRYAGDLERDGLLTVDQVKHISLFQAEGFGRRRRQQDAIRRKQLAAILGHELRLQDRRAQDVDAGERDGALAAGYAGLQLERRACQRHPFKLRDARIQRLREAAARAAHLEVGFAGERAHRGGDVAHCRLVDQMHAVAQRHAERDAGDRQRHAPARAAGAEEDEQPQHWLTILAE